MNIDKHHVTVYEHDSLKVGIRGFEKHHLEALERFHGDRDCSYFKLINKGVKFCQFVGALQVGSLTIEVLPKIDRLNESIDWQKMLIDMLRYAGILDVQTPSSASLKLKSNFILDVYFELFINECEQLLRRGLIKKYRKKEGNLLSLKGSLNFSQNVKHNIVHAERFYCNYTTYDTENIYNQILYKTLLFIHSIYTQPFLSARLNQLILDFPELKDIKVDESVFNNLPFSRKTEPYKNAIGIAKLLLLNYHPDIVKGRENVLAIMFDMNKLWEKFVFRSLQRNSIDVKEISAQNSTLFWKGETYNKTIRPDIRIKLQDKTIILDTKWKIPYDNTPSDADLKQMFAYNLNYDASESFLIYPGQVLSVLNGKFHQKDHFGECSLMIVSIFEESKLNKNIGSLIINKLTK